jgi:hypothetical protein
LEVRIGSFTLVGKTVVLLVTKYLLSMSFLKKLFRSKAYEEPGSSVKEGAQATAESFESVKNKIFPYFKKMDAFSGTAVPLPEHPSEADKNKVYAAPGLQLVIKRIVQGLNLLYAVDKDYGYEIIQAGKLIEWGITEDELHATAIDNLNNLLLTELKIHGDSNRLMLTVNGNLEAGIVLVDYLWDQIESQIQDVPVIAVPSRDVLLITGVHKKEHIVSIREKAKEIYESGDYPLSDLLYKRENGQWVVFEQM